LLATIRFLSEFPCPRCWTNKRYIDAIGTTADEKRRSKFRFDNLFRQGVLTRVWNLIFIKGRALGSIAVENALKPFSWIPVQVSCIKWTDAAGLNSMQNAFSVNLGQFGFNFHEVLVPDILHEVELGVWKAVFTHLIRLLYFFGQQLVMVLNER
jgi:hypothetical protein